MNVVQFCLKNMTEAVKNSSVFSGINGSKGGGVQRTRSFNEIVEKVRNLRLAL